MAFSERVRAWLKGESKRGAVSKSSAPASRGSTRELEAFAASRHGVEAFLEPKTAIYAVTLLLVAGDGEYLRRPIGDRAHAVSLCDDLHVPLYDAAKVGYPRRMQDFEAGVRRAPVHDDELPPWPGEDTPDPGPPPPPPADDDRP